MKEAFLCRAFDKESGKLEDVIPKLRSTTARLEQKGATVQGLTMANKRMVLSLWRRN